VWLPLTATFFVITLVVELLDRTVLLIPQEYRPEAVLGFSIPGFGVILAIAILIVTGLLAANLLGRQLVRIWEAIVSRIPLVRTVYNSVKQISATVLTSDGKAFRKVVLLEYPRSDVWSMGFLTNDHIDIRHNRINQDVAAVFVPTTPNPTSGFIVMVPREDIIELDINIEEGFKYIISMGVIVPDRTIAELLPADKVAQTSGGS